MDTANLRTFLEIVRRGSFSEAASALALSQPAVTFQVQRLERDLGVRLLERGGGRISLTAEGEEFRRYAEKTLDQERLLRESLSRLTSEISGRLSIAASTVPGEFLVPSLLADFTRHYPDVQATVSVADTEQVVERVLHAECDLGFTGARSERGGFQQVLFLRDPVVLIVPPAHPFAARAGVRLEELHGQPLVTREVGSGTMSNVRHLLQQAGYDTRDWANATVLGSTQAVISAVQAGLGISFVSAYAAALATRAGAIRALTVDGVKLERDLYIVYQEGRLSTRLQREFVAFAQSWGQTHAPPALA